MMNWSDMAALSPTKDPMPKTPIQGHPAPLFHFLCSISIKSTLKADTNLFAIH
jgi:hypothetical protein